MSFLFIILIIIALWLIFSPYIRPWLRRRAEQKLADMLRSQMGMPTEKEQRRARKEAERQEKRRGRDGFWTRRERRQQPAPDPSQPIIPKEYAVDVEFTEIKEFSQQTVISGDDSSRSRKNGRSSTKVVAESQVSDVEFTEIKN